MIENVTIVDKNGNGILAEGIIYLQYLSNAKKYITYTLNEKVNDDLNKMYVAETTEEIGSLEKMPDEDWKIIKDILNNLSTGNNSSDIQFLNMNNGSFNIGIPKKLAITTEVKQALKDLYFSKMLEQNQEQGANTPAVTGDIPDTAIPNTGATEVPTFTPTPTSQDSVQPSYYQEANNGNVNPQEAAPMPSAINAMASSYNGAVASMPSDGPAPMPSYQAPANQGPMPIYSQNDQANDYNEFDMVTKEEALRALDTLNRYFKHTKELPSSLATDFKEYSNNIVPFKPKEASQAYNGQPGMINPSASVINTAQQSQYKPVPQSFEQMSSNNNVAYSPNVDYINQQMPRISDTNLVNFVDTSRGNGYMATNNGAALNMNYSNGYVKDIPVALPSNYMPTNNIALGAGSLPVMDINNKYIA